MSSITSEGPSGPVYKNRFIHYKDLFIISGPESISILYINPFFFMISYTLNFPRLQQLGKLRDVCNLFCLEFTKSWPLFWKPISSGATWLMVSEHQTAHLCEFALTAGLEATADFWRLHCISYCTYVPVSTHWNIIFTRSDLSFIYLPYSGHIDFLKN